MSWLLILTFGLLAGLVQGLTGFGSAIIMMIVLPTIMPIAQGAGVATLIMAASVITLTIRYRHDIHLKRVILPFIVYAAMATWSVHLGQHLDLQLLRHLLGVLLIALALYFTLAPKAGNHPYPLIVAIGFMLISGFFNGLFGIGGPLMALYFLTLSSTTEEYVATVQAFFLIDIIYITTLRISQGILTITTLPTILIGMAGALIGTIIAAHLLNRLNMTAVKRLIYLFIGMSGLYYLFL
ncbi:sulfite exporter TauE/SafE family protein [Levilactobacillus huananensis]|uniref:sulfite exporter TauE/SafE family protein n=1 Tax=Levilactobacillus huananensis TaxID=2486019 RepID=UPI000F79BCC4|nr:sulfite exporter TauE/SafE family protein [Levilactobacillus huananensis]